MTTNGADGNRQPGADSAGALRPLHSVLEPSSVGGVTAAVDGTHAGERPALPTLEQVARHADVSIATASRVVTGSVPVSPARRERVERAISALGYVPDERARDLRRGAQRAVGFLVPTLDGPLYADVYRHVHRVLRRHGLTLVAFETAEEREAEAQAVEVLLRSGARALVAASAGGLADETLRRLAQRDVRVIHFDDRPPGDGVSSVTLADRDDVRELTQHLLAHGHRRIGFVSGALDGSSGRGRLEGYEEALRGAGLPVDPELVRGYGWTHAVGRRAADELLELARRPTAILTAHPCTVVGVVEAVRARGLRIPADVSLATAFEADQIRYLDPPITSMTGCDEVLGEAIARLVMATRYRPEQIVVRPTLATRASVGPAPAAA